MDLLILAIIAISGVIIYFLVKAEIKIEQENEENAREQERLNRIYEKQRKEAEAEEVKKKTQEILNDIEKSSQNTTREQHSNKFYKEPPNINYSRSQTQKKNNYSKSQNQAKSNKQQYTDYRKTHPAEFRCIDGHYVRSKSEREIDNFFFYNNIKHIYEFEYHNNIRGKTYFTDFYLPDYNLYIEYFGRNDPEYLKKKSEKIAVYRSDMSIKFEYLDFNDDHNIDGKLKYMCQKHNIPTK